MKRTPGAQRDAARRRDKKAIGVVLEAPAAEALERGIERRGSVKQAVQHALERTYPESRKTR